jgi:hypothetical protein
MKKLVGEGKPFHSAVDKTAALLKRKVGTGAEFMKELMGITGIKPTELQERGLTEIMGMPKMTHDQFMAALGKKPAPVLREKILGGDRSDPDSEAPYHGEWTLPGGENYREMLIKAPKGGEEFNGGPNHFGGEPGILASMRLKDRTGPNGEKLLHLEELQSDWHQKGRERGYKDPNEIQATEAEANQIAKQRRDLVTELVRHEQQHGFISPEMQQRWNEFKETEDTHKQKAKDVSNRLPDAPFKKNWEEMALKRLIHHAAEKGYHGVVVTPGAEQAERYNIGNRIGYLGYHPEEERLKAYGHDRREVMNETGIKKEDLPSHIGKEVADRLLKAPQVLGTHQLEGEDIHVGGKGMKGFYDTKVPNILNSIGKKYGVKTQLHVPSLGMTRDAYLAKRGIREENGNMFLGENNQFPIRSSQVEKDYLEENPNVGTKVHHFPITEEMRKDVLTNGLPLYAEGGIIHKAEGGSMNTPDLAQSRFSISQRANPALMDNIGIDEALDMNPKTFITPDPKMSGGLPVGGVDKVGGLPIGGVDQSSAPGMQFAPQQPQQDAGAPQGGLPQMGGQPPSAGPSSPGQQPHSNILSLTPQGRALGAMAPQGMATGGSAKQRAQAKFMLEKRMAHLADGGQPPEDEPYENTSKRKRILFRGSGYGEVQGIIVPRHMWHGGKEKDGKRVLGMKDLNEARAQVYGSENRNPMAISAVEKLHRNVLQSHFARPIDEQIAAEEAALNKLRLAKHIGHGSNTLDKSVKLDTVNHEHDEQGRTYKGFASKGVVGSSLYTSGHGENRKFHIINTCPGQTSDCGGGYDKNGIADSLNGSCFAPKSEAQYVAASVRRAAHEQAKHDPAMTSDWILAHTGSLRDAADTADRQNKRILFRPNVVDETDRSSRLAIGHLNRQREASKKPSITSNQYGKTTELNDPANGIHVTHSNTGPKVKDGATVEANVERDKTRIRETHLASDASGRDYTNEQGEKTPTKGSYFVTGVKRHSPLSKEMEKHITHAKYWNEGTPVDELRGKDKNASPEGHYDANGEPTSEDLAHYGHRTIVDDQGIARRYDYQKQHVLHPRLVNVPERKKNKITGKMETVEHMIPTDSRFKDVDYLPPTPFMSKNGKVAGHILMTTPTESTTNEEHLNGFMHPVDFADIEHAKQNNGEYVVDAPEKQEAARGKIFIAPKEVKITKMKKRKKFALGGIVDGDEEQDHDLNDDDFYAFPERNSAAQRHLAKRRSTVDADELHHAQLYRHEA